MWHLHHRLRTCAIYLLVFFSLTGRMVLAETTANQFVNAVVRVDSTVLSNGRTVDTLGESRSGSGVIIDANGLLVTAGYLVLEARSIQVTFNDGQTTTAEIVANDTISGLALLRASLPDNVVAMAIGSSATVAVGDDALVLSHGGVERVAVASIADIRGFSAAWEYHLDSAFYSSPAYPVFSGAALINPDAELIGIGSLILSDIGVAGQSPTSGNLFIPIDSLTANLGSLLARGRSLVEPRAWLGVYLAETDADLRIVRLADTGPAQQAGVQADDSVIAINGQRVQSMEDFYKKLWGSGVAGSEVELLLSRKGQIQSATVISADRQSWFRTPGE